MMLAASTPVKVLWSNCVHKLYWRTILITPNELGGSIWNTGKVGDNVQPRDSSVKVKGHLGTASLFSMVA